MKVERVSDPWGSHIEPALDEMWSDLQKLQWRAAVIECDEGVLVDVEVAHVQRKVGGRWVRVPGQYAVGGIHSMDFQGAWDCINGVGIGARLANQQVAPR